MKTETDTNTFPYIPPAIERRTIYMGIKLTPTERDELQRRSGAKNRGDFSDWVRRALFAYPYVDSTEPSVSIEQELV